MNIHALIDISKDIVYYRRKALCLHLTYILQYSTLSTKAVVHNMVDPSEKSLPDDTCTASNQTDVQGHTTAPTNRQQHKSRSRNQARQTPGHHVMALTLVLFNVVFLKQSVYP